MSIQLSTTNWLNHYIKLEIATKKGATQEEGALKHVNPSWGREGRPSSLAIISSLCIMVFCPLITLATHGAIHHSNGSILDMLLAFDYQLWIPSYTAESFKILAAWILFQGFLYVTLPGKTGYGQPTPAGHTLPYTVNGLTAWVVTHALFLYGAYITHWW
jgi:7-dehydrocholesterol reductase